jgi:tetratricopeptide (TPR) repeat protein
LNKVLDEHKLSTTGIIDENSAKQLGKILGVDAIASGTISDLGNSIKLNSRLFATETGLIFAAAAVEILMNDAIQNLLEEGITDNQEEKNDNKDKFYYYNNGVYLLNANSFEEAEKKFLKAIQIDPEYDNAIYNLGVTYVKWGTEAFSKAKEEGRVDESYKEKYNRAIPYLEKVVAKDSENKQIWELLGKVYSVLGMEAEAKNAFNKSNQ